MITVDSLIWGFKSSLEASPLPYPFNLKTNKRLQVEHPTTHMVVNATVINGVVKATMIMIALQETAAGRDPSRYFEDIYEGVAIGTRSNSDASETIYVEKPSKSRKCTDIIKYNPATGEIKGVFYPETGRPKPYKIKGSGGTDGTAIFLAMMDELIANVPEIKETFNNVKTKFEESASTEELWNDMLLMSYLVYEALAKNGSVKCNLEETSELEVITATNIKRGYDGPSKGKVTYGQFKVLKVGEKKSTTEKKKDFEAKFKKAAELPFLRTEKDFSTAELAMIPTVSAIHVPSDAEYFIVGEIIDTFEDPLNSIKTLMLLGQSSSGKSHLAQTLAARMRRPYSAPLTCTPNMDETTLLGTTLPVIEGGSERDKLSKADNDLLDELYGSSDIELALQSALNIPDADTILYDPVGAYEELTGKAKKDATSNEVITLSQVLMQKKIKELAENLPNDGVKYMYYKSPLVKAIENGWMIEIQEFNVCKEAAIFTSLNNVFDKDANGILETPYGQVVRHPDFRAIYTANPEYAGCRDPHQSVIARSDMIVTMDMPSQKVMMDRVKKRMKFEDKDLLKQVVDTFMAVVDRANEISCNGEATMRELYRFANAILREAEPQTALENYVINAITRDKDDKAELMEAAEQTELMNQ